MLICRRWRKLIQWQGPSQTNVTIPLVVQLPLEIGSLPRNNVQIFMNEEIVSRRSQTICTRHCCLTTLLTTDKHRNSISLWYFGGKSPLLNVEQWPAFLEMRWNASLSLVSTCSRLKSPPGNGMLWSLSNASFTLCCNLANCKMTTSANRVECFYGACPEEDDQLGAQLCTFHQAPVR